MDWRLLLLAFTTLVLLLVLVVLVLDRVRRDRLLRRVAAQIAADDLDTKLEVFEGALGELCYAINRLQQQRRNQQRLQRLLPALPSAGRSRLGELHIPIDGLECEVAVLALGLPTVGVEPLERLREAASAVSRQAEINDALIIRSDGRILLIFGAFGQTSPAAAMRGAYSSAQALHGVWAGRPVGEQPIFTLAGGRARAVVLPGLGYTVLGPPIEQALGLQRIAEVAADLVCNEDAYLNLRRIGSAPAQAPVPRLSAVDGHPAYSVPLVWAATP